MLEIVNFPHPALRYSSRPVTEIDDSLRATIRAMFKLMYAAKGIGLAANQVALPFRFFVLNLTADPERKDEERVFINPEIVKRHSSTEDEEEVVSACPVSTPRVLQGQEDSRFAAYGDLEGTLVEYEADELLSRVIQHETDHLEGKLFIDYLEPLERRSLAEKLRVFELDYQKAQQNRSIPADDDLLKRLNAMSKPVEDGPIS